MAASDREWTTSGLGMLTDDPGLGPGTDLRRARPGRRSRATTPRRCWRPVLDRASQRRRDWPCTWPTATSRWKTRRRRSSHEGRPDDRGPGGRHLARTGRRSRAPARSTASRRCSARTTTCRSFGRASAARSTPGRPSTRCPRSRRRVRLGTLVSPATFRPSGRAGQARGDRGPRLGRPRGARASAPAGTRPSTTAYGFPFPPIGRADCARWSASCQVIAAATRSDRGRRRQSEAAAAAAPANLIVGGRGGARGIASSRRRHARRVQHGQQDGGGVRRHPGAAGRGVLARGRRDPIPLSLMVTWLAGEDRSRAAGPRPGAGRAGRVSTQTRRASCEELRGSAHRGDPRREPGTSGRAGRRRRGASDARSTWCTATWTRSSRSGAAWRRRWPEPI